MRALKVRACIAAALLLPAAAAPAMARERLVVLMVADADPALADDLTEVAIATLAERRDRELVGTRELRGRLAGVLPEGGLAVCLDRVECLARVGVTAGAARAVIGRLHPSGDGQQLELILADTGSSEILARVSTTVPAGMDPLIAAVRVGVNRLLTPEAEATNRAPPLVAVVAEPPAPGVAGLSLAPKPPEPARPHAWVPYAGAGAAVLAAVAFSAAAVTGTIAEQEPVGSTRVVAQADLEHRMRYATAANQLLVAGVVLSAAAGAAFAWWWRGARAH